MDLPEQVLRGRIWAAQGPMHTTHSLKQCRPGAGACLCLRVVRSLVAARRRLPAPRLASAYAHAVPLNTAGLMLGIGFGFGIGGGGGLLRGWKQGLHLRLQSADVQHQLSCSQRLVQHQAIHVPKHRAVGEDGCHPGVPAPSFPHRVAPD